MDLSLLSCFFFFNDTATTEIYTLSLHDALPIWTAGCGPRSRSGTPSACASPSSPDRKSTRLNSSHSQISYAGFCLKKKKKKGIRRRWQKQTGKKGRHRKRKRKG